MAKTSPTQFIKQIISELSRVVWPSRKETILSTFLIVLLVSITSIFFLILDQILSRCVKWILNIGG